MERQITDLKGIHEGADIYVVASGPSAGYIEPSFFENKVSIGVNEVYHHFPVTYSVRKDFVMVTEAYQSGIPLIVSRFDCGSLRKFTPLPKLSGNGDYYVFNHSHNGRTVIDLDVIGTDSIIVSFSTITTAMHLAAYMGAANIILVGHDCGTIDGKMNMEGYHKPTSGEGFYHQFLAEIEPQTIAVRDRLREVYGCNVYSLNPWVNLGLEGHQYQRTEYKHSSATGDIIGDEAFRRALRDHRQELNKVQDGIH